MLRKLPIIGVFGQGTPIAEERAALARAVGARIAQLGAHLSTGGATASWRRRRKASSPSPAAQAFRSASSRAIRTGRRTRRTRRWIARPTPIRTSRSRYTPLPSRVADWRSMPGRDQINVLSADAVIALPGGVGTDNELTMAAAYRGEAERTPGQRRTVLFRAWR